MPAVEVRLPVRIADIAFVVERSVQGRITAGGCIQRLRKRVCTLKVTGTPAARECRLQRVVMRVGIVSEDLETTVPVHPQEIGACNRVGRGACSNRDLASIGQCYEYGLGLSSELRLNIGSCFAQVHGMRSDIPNLKNPLLA